MKKTFVYKYRSGNTDLKIGQKESDFERDLKSIERNLLFASSIESLNDPCESMVSLGKFKTETNLYSKILGDKEGKVLEFNKQIEGYIF